MASFVNRKVIRFFPYADFGMPFQAGQLQDIMRKLVKYLSLLVVLVAFISCSNEILAQDKRYDYDQLLNCERSLQYQVAVLNQASQFVKNGRRLIVIVRLGKGEESRELLRRRMYNLHTFIEQNGTVGLDKVVFAEGPSVAGYGQVEFYINGELAERLLYPKNGYICHSCCGPDSMYYPWKANIITPKKNRKARP